MVVGRAEEGEGDTEGEGRKMGLSETFRVGGDRTCISTYSSFTVCTSLVEGYTHGHCCRCQAGHLPHLLVLLVGCKLYGCVRDDANHVGPIALHAEGGRWVRCQVGLWCLAYTNPCVFGWGYTMNVFCLVFVLE